MLCLIKNYNVARDKTCEILGLRAACRPLPTGEQNAREVRAGFCSKAVKMIKDLEGLDTLPPQLKVLLDKDVV